MQVNRKSWHYRLLQIMDFEKPRSLCPYARKVLAALFIAFSGAFALGIVVWILISYWLFVFGVQFDNATGPIVGFAIHCFFAFAGVSWWYQEWGYKHFPVKDRAPEPEREPGLLVSWWRATHDKICPPINYTNG